MPDTTDLNQQITDSINFMQKMLSETEENDLRSVSYKLLVQAAGLAMFNAVFQQQQMYILQNAVTTATTKSILESKPDEAVKIFNEVYQKNDIVNTLSGLKQFIDELNNLYKDLAKEKPKTRPKEEEM